MQPTPTDDYLRFLLSNPHISASNLFSLFFLGLFRIGPIVAIAPFLGAKLPGAVKVGLALSLTTILLPQLMTTTGQPISFDLHFIAFALKEVLIGSILAFVSTIPFYIAEGSGTLIDFMRGASSLQVTNPFMQTQTSSIGVLFNYILVVIFFYIGAPFVFLNILAESFRILPVDMFLHPSFFSLAVPFWKMIIGLLTRVTAVSVQLAAPAAIACLMADVFLGIANRLAPQVQIVFLGAALKSLLGLGMLWAGWLFILKQMGTESLAWLTELDHVLRFFHM